MYRYFDGRPYTFFFSGIISWNRANVALQYIMAAHNLFWLTLPYFAQICQLLRNNSLKGSIFLKKIDILLSKKGLIN